MTGYVHASHGLLLFWKKTKDVQYKLIFLFWQNVVSKNEEIHCWHFTYLFFV